METASTSSTYSTPSDQEVADLHYFSANDDDHQYLRLRCGMLCAAFNAQPLSISDVERARAWYDIVDPNVRDRGQLPEAPMVKSPIYLDYGITVQIAPSCFINRSCVFLDSPLYPIVVGENTVLGPGVQIHGVTHPVDWRERTGKKGPSLAGPVRIGRDCFIGSYAVILPGITIGDGCVIGASSVVTRSIPPYHVAIGSPATPVRKVSDDVPDAPGLQYERRGNRSIVRTYPFTRIDEAEASKDVSLTEETAEIDKQLRDVLSKMSVVSPWQVMFDAVVLIAALLIFWAIVHGVLN